MERDDTATYNAMIQRKRRLILHSVREPLPRPASVHRKTHFVNNQPLRTRADCTGSAIIFYQRKRSALMEQTQAVRTTPEGKSPALNDTQMRKNGDTTKGRGTTPPHNDATQPNAA